MSLLQEVKEQKRIIKNLEDERIQMREKLENTYYPIMSKEHRRKEAKKKGNKWLIAAGILMILPLLWFPTLGIGYSFAGLLILCIPLAVGIVKKSRGIKECNQLQEELRGVDVERIYNEATELEFTTIRSINASIDAAKEKRESLTMYNGRNWDMTTFTATPENVQALEKDAESLLLSRQHIAGSQQIIANWLCRYRMELFHARLGQDEALANTLDRGFQELGRSGSWKLEVLQHVMLSMDMALMSASFGGDKPMYFEELFEKSNTRKPETQDEWDFYEVAATGSLVMNSSLTAVIRKNLGGV